MGGGCGAAVGFTFDSPVPAQGNPGMEYNAEDADERREWAVTQSRPTEKSAFRKPGKIAVKATVRCGEQMHRIVLTKSGRLVLVDHPDLKAERAMVALGGKPCRCLEVLDAWRCFVSHGPEYMGTHLSGLPPKLRKSVHMDTYLPGLPPKLKKAVESRHTRCVKLRCGEDNGDWLCQPLPLRQQVRICQIVKTIAEVAIKNWFGVQPDLMIAPVWQIGQPVIVWSSTVASIPRFIR